MPGASYGDVPTTRLLTPSARTTLLYEWQGEMREHADQRCTGPQNASDTMNMAAMLITAYCQRTGMSMDTLASYLQAPQQRSRATGPRDADRHEIAGSCDGVPGDRPGLDLQPRGSLLLRDSEA
nr:hypothetical protein OH837_39050 [Streptomyces canus]